MSSSSSTTEHQARVAALLGVVEGGGRFFADDARTYAWSQECPLLRDHVTKDRDQAILWQAFHVDRPYHPKAQNRFEAGWQLARFVGGGGGIHPIGYAVATRGAFADQMRLLREFHEQVSLSQAARKTARARRRA